MLRSFQVRALAVCAAVFFLASAAAAQTKVGVINLEKAMLDTAELKKAVVDLPLKYKPQQDQLERLQKEMADIQNQLQSGKLNPSQQADLEATGAQKQRQAERLNQDLQDEVNNDRTAILQRAQTRMYEVVKKLCEEKGIDVLLSSAAAFYFKDAVEITAEATAAYDKAYPLKATP
ncbi:MAG TPA: OmpH family outer membrane protein [Bryobacteraceae bacterium]|nr:OmpH family outer membrane protein [Bryobacteraceae bacterium]